jgi:hypothetical protein
MFDKERGRDREREKSIKTNIDKKEKGKKKEYNPFFFLV